MTRLIKFSTRMNRDRLDWIRTLYFSLFGSAALNFAMKWRSMELISGALFFFGVSLFLVGLFASMRISLAFKRYEQRYSRDKDLQKHYETVSDYIESEETGFYKSIQHILFYILLLSALAVIGWSGYIIESKSAESSQSTKDQLRSMEVSLQAEQQHYQTLDSLHRQEIISLNELLRINEQMLDSIKIMQTRK